MRVIHLLNWKLNDIEKYLDEIKESGFDAIQINPMQPFKNTGRFNWWASYQPLDFKIGNEFGNRIDLENLCNEAKKRNIKIIVDVVCNHMANNGGTFNDMVTPNDGIPVYLKSNKNYWKKHTKVYDFKNWNDVINESIGLPGLNLKNHELQSIIFRYLDELKECGVSGFRIDAAKHIGLPSDGNDFFEKLNKYSNENELTVYGEFLGDYKDKKNELSKYINVLTEPSSHIDKSDKMFTFVESHDSFLNEDGYTKGKRFNDITLEYSDLCENYNNTIFYVRDNFKPYNPDGCEINSYYRNNYSTIDIVLNNEQIKNANAKTAKSNIKMKYNEETFKKTCMNIHSLILNNVSDYTSLDMDKIIEIILLDYEILTHLNRGLEITTNNEIDIYLLDCIMYELYTNNIMPMHYINYEDCYKRVLYELKNRLLDINSNYNSINENIVKQKIKKLNNKTINSDLETF